MNQLAIKPKKRGNHKTKIAQYQKRARAGMLGFSLSWGYSDPFSENSSIYGGEIDHLNPTQKIICRDMWRRCSQWIVTQEFTWQVIMRVVYIGTEKGDKYDDYDHVFTCTLRGNKSDILNDAMEKNLSESLAGNNAFPEGHKNKGVYSHCEFLAVVIGV